MILDRCSPIPPSFSSLTVDDVMELSWMSEEGSEWRAMRVQTATECGVGRSAMVCFLCFFGIPRASVGSGI